MEQSPKPDYWPTNPYTRLMDDGCYSYANDEIIWEKASDAIWEAIKDKLCVPGSDECYAKYLNTVNAKIMTEVSSKGRTLDFDSSNGGPIPPASIEFLKPSEKDNALLDAREKYKCEIFKRMGIPKKKT